MKLLYIINHGLGEMGVFLCFTITIINNNAIYRKAHGLQGSQYKPQWPGSCVAPVCP